MIMTAATSDELLTNLRNSQLVPPERLDEWLASCPGSTADPPKTLAIRLVSTGLVTSFQADLLLEGRRSGFFIAGKYKVLDLLGKGGMGAVYLCEHQVLKTLVAVKVLSTVPGENGEARERFHREARAFATLNHPNLVRGFDVDKDGTIHFIVMEYVDGVDLQLLVARRGPLPVARAVNYIRQAASGLTHAHAQGWVHRDIKPANLAVDRAGLVRVLDMGLARLVLDGGDGVTRNDVDGCIRGTADYLAPEQANGGHVDGRADFYSLGVTLYYLLTARLPFGGENTAQKLLAHQIKTPPSIRAIRPEVPDRLARVVETMMAKQPAHRHQTGLDLTEALAAWDDGGPFVPSEDEIPPRLVPGTASPSTPAPTPARSAPTRSRSVFESKRDRRSLGVMTVCGLAVAVLVGVGLIGFWFLNPPLPPRDALTPPTVARTASPFVGNYVPVTRAHGPNQVPFPGGYTEYLNGRVYPTVAAALADPRVRELENCRILLLDEVHEEQVVVDGARIPPGLSVGSARTDPPTEWIPPEHTDPAQPLLRLTGGSRAAVRHLTFNGMGRVDAPLAWIRPGPGCQLHDLRVTKFTGAGVILDSPAGDPDDPVQVSRVRVHPDAGAPVDSCVAVRGPARHLRLTDCRFEGSAAVGLMCDCGMEYLEVTGCRLFGLQNGLRFAGPGKLRATVVGNTTARVPSVVRIDVLAPVLDKDDRLLLRNNLFFEATAAVRLWDGQSGQAGELFRGSSGNWCEAGGCPTPTPALPVSPSHGLILGLDPTRDAEFLRYPANSPMATGGPDGRPVGVPPQQ
ncbi:MAG: serine/threonine protein kinase [Gemmataceae bacterium]|nr:serine/threonine protein kinase [Gemmataceae bacterium]